ncbi:hypothetical protein THAOC_12027 [Thalassiosira oceanica]|uniref:Uncharacterized protein n=1 Tax=Thalassiosira oceanica TaxID=159749 RepID=K0SNP4_THAOC|nr:hypothetical protein THAOC_12027 [Thalassiosira oceanica]|eukprot:EJK66995.1 hypothetical protein THAOC_12027 [Thalassiosira oceanica]
MVLAQEGADEVESPSIVITTHISNEETPIAMPTQLPASPTMAPPNECASFNEPNNGAFDLAVGRVQLCAISQLVDRSKRQQGASFDEPNDGASFNEPNAVAYDLAVGRGQLCAISHRLDRAKRQQHAKRTSHELASAYAIPVSGSHLLTHIVEPSVASANPLARSHPSQAPSLEDILSYKREYDQRLWVSVRQSLNKKQMGELQYLYEQYTVKFGYFVIGNSTVRPDCQIIKQDLQEVASSSAAPYPLQISFTMRYSTKIGAYNISAYNLNFQQWMNENLINTTQDLAKLYLIPVVESQRVYLIVEESDPTPPASLSPTLFRPPTLRPVTQGPTTTPVTASPSLSSTTASPSVLILSSPSGDLSATPLIPRVDPNWQIFRARDLAWPGREPSWSR